MPDPSTPLSKHFTLSELLYSSTAERDPNLKALQLTPSPEVVTSLQYLVSKTLQPIRNALGSPMHITSGYRHPTVNKLVGGSGTSQHVPGEAADCQLSPSFLTDPKCKAVRDKIRKWFTKSTGRPIPADANANFYLFAYVCMEIDSLDVDQVIHEYGDAFGRPAWVHISASTGRDNREALIIGLYTDFKYIRTLPTSAVDESAVVGIGASRAARGLQPVTQFTAWDYQAPRGCTIEISVVPEGLQLQATAATGIKLDNQGGENGLYSTSLPSDSPFTERIFMTFDFVDAPTTATYRVALRFAENGRTLATFDNIPLIVQPAGANQRRTITVEAL